MKLSEQILRLRRDKGLSQEKLSEQLGISRQAVSRWETGESTPDLNNLMAICEILETTPNELLGFSDENVQDESISCVDNAETEDEAQNIISDDSTLIAEADNGKNSLSSLQITAIIIIALLAIAYFILYGFMNYYKELSERDAILADMLPGAVEFENIGYDIGEVNAKVNYVTITFKPTDTPDGAVYGVLAKTGGKSNVYLIDKTSKPNKDGLISAELNLPEIRGDGEIIIYMTHGGICTSQTVYSFVHTNDNHKVEMTPLFE